MLKKYKMMIEFIAKKETEDGAMGFLENIRFIDKLSKVAKKNGFDAFCKGYPKEIINYKPTNKEYNIKTVEDIANLTEEQFEMFIPDLRSFCNVMKGVNELNKIGIEAKREKGMVRIDSGLNTTNIKVQTEVTNKI